MSRNPPGTFAAYWNAYIPRALLPHLHAYELMMAPYATRRGTSSVSPM